jgi:hypothetical protein
LAPQYGASSVNVSSNKVGNLARESKKLGIAGREIQRTGSAFDHADLRKASELAGKNVAEENRKKR